MTTKEKIKQKIDNIPESHLDKLYKLIKDFEIREQSPQGIGLLSKLKEVKIKGPKDFSKNIDQYLSGEVNGE